MSEPMSAEGLRRENADLRARLIAIDEAYRHWMTVARGNSFNIPQDPDRYNAIVRTFHATMQRGGRDGE